MVRTGSHDHPKTTSDRRCHYLWARGEKNTARHTYSDEQLDAFGGFRTGGT